MAKMIKFQNVSKIYNLGEQEVLALNDVSFEIETGKVTVILGPSGSGKSTALNLLGGMDRASKGIVEINDTNLTKLNDHQLSDYRRKIVGFVFQFYNLIPSLTALENIGIAANLTKNDASSKKYLEAVSLTSRRDNFPSQLSGGEMQRVAIARALAKKPKLLLCDEPTGALDSQTGRKIIQLLKEASNQETSVILVTHNAAIAPIADRVIYLHDGKIAKIVDNAAPVDPKKVAW
ncbi:ABC transporter ATP-binding protein [Sporolactobacillus sp. CQH2019]|uniref:ABC transporter ATP-binding protein n=1 Tax=Sporolactobacillus sp. CQH2019 TaxID=3023512 RepID=UPI002367AF1F|nr:ABC transporter ATP-binding protein [Sporolactobacillus sp. CQH2019]MDD9149925.1 ABC transporter ATP-binding protein [Sporolactobacillus sp. CQH2019]